MTAIVKTTKPNIVAIIQGRMSSNRLPGKILRDIGGEPMLSHVVQRVRRSRLIRQVVVATTADPSDDPVTQFCQRKGIPVFRGNLFDVLDRYYQAARYFAADIVVRITADCPLIDPQEIDRTIQALLDNQVDFAANRLPPPFTRTTPIGMDTEVVTFDALERAWHEADQKYEREHVLPYLYDEPGRFKTLILEHDPDLGHLRWTVDTPQDLEVVREIFASFNNRDDFSMAELIDHAERHPEWQLINANIHHNSYLETDNRDKGTA